LVFHSSKVGILYFRKYVYFPGRSNARRQLLQDHERLPQLTDIQQKMNLDKKGQLFEG